MSNSERIENVQSSSMIAKTARFTEGVLTVWLMTNRGFYSIVQKEWDKPETRSPSEPDV